MVNKIVKYAEQNSQFSRFELAKLKYMLEMIFLNVGELLLLFGIFTFLGKMTEFFVAAAVLLSVRSFAGGFHLAKFRYCVILSVAIFWAIIMILPAIDITQGLMEALLLISILINLLLAPVSKRNYAQLPKNRLIFKCISTVILLIYAFFILRYRDSPYAVISTWTIFFQSFQLIVGRGLILYEKNAS